MEPVRLKLGEVPASMSSIEYLSYVCVAIRNLHARLIGYGTTMPMGTLEMWL